MEDNRKFAHMNDRDYLRFFVFHEWLLTLIVNFGTFCYIVHILYLNPKEAPLGSIQHYFNIIFAPGLLIWFWWLELHLITCRIDYFFKSKAKTDCIRIIKRFKLGYTHNNFQDDTEYYIAESSGKKKRLYKINNDRIVWDQENSVKTKRNIGGKTVYVPKEPRIEIGKTYKVTYYPISKLVVRAEEVK